MLPQCLSTEMQSRVCPLYSLMCFKKPSLKGLDKTVYWENLPVPSTRTVKQERATALRCSERWLPRMGTLGPCRFLSLFVESANQKKLNCVCIMVDTCVESISEVRLWVFYLHNAKSEITSLSSPFRTRTCTLAFRAALHLRLATCLQVFGKGLKDCGI